MLINPDNYLWSRSPIITFSLTEGEQLIDNGIAVRFYAIEGDATISLYEDSEKTNLLFEGDLPVEFETPISCNAMYVICNAATDVNVICEIGIPKADLTPYLNTTSGMTTLASSNDDNTYSVSWNAGFKYNGSSISTFYVSSNNWYGFGSSSEQLKIMRRDGYASYIRYLKGSLREGLDFLKIRYEGYTVYNSKTTANRLIYEVFFLSNNDIFINLIQTPTSSNTGTSEIVCNGVSKSLSLVDSTGKGGGKKITLVSTSELGNAYDIEYREYQEPTAETECYLLKMADGFYTLENDELVPVDIEVEIPTPTVFLKYGFDALPPTEFFSTLSNPHLYYWRSDTVRQRFTANIDAVPFPQVITATADLDHESIIGITDMTAQYGGTVMAQYSVDGGITFTEEMILADMLNVDMDALFESAQATKRINFRFTLYPDSSLTSFRIHYTN